MDTPHIRLQLNCSSCLPAVDPGGAVPPDAPHQPQTVRLYTAQVTRDLPPEPAAPHSGSTRC
ncbi:hypothetical protein EYF80_020444 [Liparis tanakae]|uniref:Uncharacterized protein n=1 Tax=Liparis tanakae TaxID=230148 RepID=A0A4Z2HWD9_9TELE|nr:hypothetical protein EYF80_020444 [Liparis tanakae]